MRTLALYNLKGGVGKTASAVNLAYLAAENGFSVCVWDLDPQGSASWYFQASGEPKFKSKKLSKRAVDLSELIESTQFEGLDIIPASIKNRDLDKVLSDVDNGLTTINDLIKPLRKHYAFLIIDCPPSISALSEAIFYASDRLIIPTIPTHLSINTVEKFSKLLLKEGMEKDRMLTFFNMVDRRRNLHKALIDCPPKSLPNVLNTYVPNASMVERMGDTRAPLPYTHPKDSVSTIYRFLWQEIFRKSL